MENPQSANNHRDEGEIEDEQRYDEGKQIHCQVADDEEEDERVDVLRGDDGAQPQDARTRRPVHQVLLHLHGRMQRVIQHLKDSHRPQRVHKQRPRSPRGQEKRRREQ